MQSQDLKAINIALAAGALTATGAETVYDTTVVVPFTINGKFYSLAAITNGVMPLLDGNTGVAFLTLAASRGCLLVFATDASDVVSVYQGNVTVLDTGNDFEVAPVFGSVPDTVTPFAYMVLKNSSAGSTFTIGTSNWNATGATNVIQDIAVLPDRPQEA